MRELRHAVTKGKPLIALMETEPKQGGVTAEEMHEQVVASERHFAGWGFAPGAGGVELARKLFEVEPLEWVRLSHFQDVTMRRLAERLLPPHMRGATYVQDEVARRHTMLPPPKGRHTHHLYVSPHNQNANALATEVAAARKLRAFRCTSSIEQLASCNAMLICIHTGLESKRVLPFSSLFPLFSPHSPPPLPPSYPTLSSLR